MEKMNECETYTRRAASRCCTSLFRSRTLKIYCRSWSVMRSKTCCDCCNKSEPLMCVSAVESAEYPVDASIIRWIVDTCVGVGGKRALRPLPIFLYTEKKRESKQNHSFSWCEQKKFLHGHLPEILITFYNNFEIKIPHSLTLKLWQ